MHDEMMHMTEGSRCHMDVHDVCPGRQWWRTVFGPDASNTIVGACGQHATIADPVQRGDVLGPLICLADMPEDVGAVQGCSAAAQVPKPGCRVPRPVHCTACQVSVASRHAVDGSQCPKCRQRMHTVICVPVHSQAGTIFCMHEYGHGPWQQQASSRTLFAMLANYNRCDQLQTLAQVSHSSHLWSALPVMTDSLSLQHAPKSACAHL